MARVATFTTLLLISIIHTAMSITVQEFYPSLKGNLTELKWAHATNNQSSLKAALEESTILMIEADVSIGEVPSKNLTNIPIMAHSPNSTSDLSLEDFVNQVLSNKTKGMKLDFKSLKALEQGITTIQKFNNLTVPVWLNADILPGPVNASELVDAEKFFASAIKLPQTLLSIGWGTRLNESNKNVTEAYSSENINKMLKVLQDSKSNQSVTYPVRACFAVNDIKVLQNLLTSSKSNNATLTVWSSDNDIVDAAKLSQLIKTVGVDKVYVDVPDTLRKQLNLANSAFTAMSSMSVVFASISALFSTKFL